MDVGIAEGMAGLLAAAGSGVSLLARVRWGSGPTAGATTASPRSWRYWCRARSASRCWPRPRRRCSWSACSSAFALGWGWPGLFNLAVVDLNREAPGAATGVTQTGIYVGAAAGPAAYGLVSAEYGYSAAWAASGALCVAGGARLRVRGAASRDRHVPA